MILFDHGPGGAATLFEAPERLILAHGPEDVPQALAALEAAQAAGFWLAGHTAYELGLALEPRLAPLMPADRPGPLLAFGVYPAPRPGGDMLERARALAPQAGLSAPVPQWDAATHARAFASVADYIAAGDCYQVNLTFPLHARAHGPALGLYGALMARQPVAYGAFVDLGVGPVLLSRSPELFFRSDAGGRIETCPMKGTAPRHPDPEIDAGLKAALAGSEKNRAENLMIVDLLRNDLSRLCLPGSVRVPRLYEVETYATVHQMTSRVTGQVPPGTGAAALIRALFPCGSITGAPKIRAMEIIHELEPEPRGAYCGAIGWLAPDGRAQFNVAIRTLSLFGDGAVVLNVGGGVVQDSTAASEYEEALWKARFAQLA